MQSTFSIKQLRNNAEQQVFRRLNNVVEPLVRSGALSSRLAPASLVVLETTGFRSGKQRRTPLWSLKLGHYRLISTARGQRSFWMKNLQKNPAITFFVGGEARSADTIVLTPGFNNLEEWDLSPLLKRLLDSLATYTRRGWAFAVLVPEGSS